VRIKVRDRTVALKLVDDKAGTVQPPLSVDAGSRWPERPRGPEHRHIGVGTPQLAADGELADKVATRPQTSTDFSDSARGIRYAVQPVEAHAQVKLTVTERHVLDAALDDLNPAAMLGRDPTTRPF
jgi:hypothetical protein